MINDSFAELSPGGFGIHFAVHSQTLPRVGLHREVNPLNGGMRPNYLRALNGAVARSCLSTEAGIIPGKDDPRVSLFHEKVPPFRNAVRIPDEERAGQLPRHHRRTKQAQTHFLRQAVGLAAVHRLAGQDTILPRRLAAA